MPNFCPKITQNRNKKTGKPDILRQCEEGERANAIQARLAREPRKTITIQLRIRPQPSRTTQDIQHITLAEAKRVQETQKPIV